MSRKSDKDLIDIFFNHNLHIPSRTILPIHQTDEEATGVRLYETISKGILILDGISTQLPITIILNNNGGDFYHGKAIYGAIKNSSSHITIKCLGSIMSAGSFILQSGDTRLIDEDCTYMMHYGSTPLPDDHLNQEAWIRQNKIDREWMERIYLERINNKLRLDKKKLMSKKDIEKLLSVDTILDSKETVKLGLADGIIER